MAWQETPTKVVVEFLRSNQGTSRVIKLKHTPQAVPPQLQGRVDPNLWGAFMTDCQHLATQHPYSQTPSAGQVGQWASCFCIGAVLGLFCINPDGGDYGAWEAAANEVLRRYGGAFQQAGCFLSLQRTRDYFFQIDVGQPVAMGLPVAK